MLKEQRANLKLDRALWKEYSRAENYLIKTRGQCLEVDGHNQKTCYVVQEGVLEVEALKAKWRELPYLRQIGAQLSR